jgi:signal transduction histidine kinase
MRGRFVRRLGCIFILVGFLSVVGLVSLILFVANWLGGIDFFGVNLRWMIPFFILFLLGVLSFGLLTRGLHRFTAPVGDLLDAASRVAEGDFSARVAETGPQEVRALARAFNTMTSRLQASDTQRRTLLADVTHELKTPLAVLQANLEGILDGVYSADEQHLKSLLEETNILSRLVEDLRTLALSESGALHLRKEPTDLALLIHETVSAFRGQADAAGITIDVQAAEIPSLEVDPARIRQVLTNLVVNALHFTPRFGKIRILLELVGQDEKKACRITVADTGPGIPAEDLPHVFDRFYKSRDSGGMGLGLSIAKTLVELHGGTIEAASEVGQGTTVRFHIPYDRDEALA